eukprot:g16683.t1
MAKQDTQDWVAAYGVSAAEWSSITAGSETTAEQLRTFLEEGYTDWANGLLSEDFASLSPAVIRSTKTMKAVRAIVQVAMTSPTIGAVYGNSLLGEASPAYYLLGNDAPNEDDTFYEQMKTIYELDLRFGIFNEEHLDLVAQMLACSRKCVQLLHLAMQNPEEVNLPKQLCGCHQLWACSSPHHPSGTYLVRVTLGAPSKSSEDAWELRFSPLPGVRILEVPNKDIVRTG